jgi:hypothetical protein
MTATRRVQARSKVDVIERFFEWSEMAFCPHHFTKDKMPLEEDVLDYVFEHVESLACADDAERAIRSNGQPLTLQRDNSLVEPGMTGYPTMAFSGRQIEPLGQEGDFLDVCFENVQDYTCKEGVEHSKPRKSGRERRTERNLAVSSKFEETYAELEAEDEIQLYFRPKHSSRD